MSPAVSDTRLSPLSLKVLAQLEDGEWHDQEDVIDAVQYIMPPGEAYRYGQSISNAVVDRRSQDDIIASGRRHKTMQVINTLTSNGRVERRGESGRGKHKEIRLARQVMHVYVVRDANDNLEVYSQQLPDLAVHVVDLWERSTDPIADARRISEIHETIPVRMPGRDKIQQACTSLLSRLNVDALLRKSEDSPTVLQSRSFAETETAHGSEVSTHTEERHFDR